MTTYKGTPITLSADFATETLQAKREWHDILKVMKGKTLQPRILYPTRLLFTFDGEIQSFPRQAKVKRIQHHQTSFTINAKRTFLGRKYKRRKRPTQNKPKTVKNVVIGLCISIITLNVNGLNTPTKDICWLGGWKHVHVCVSTYNITLLNSPKYM